jgi:hypothetical protein
MTDAKLRNLHESTNSKNINLGIVRRFALHS